MLRDIARAILFCGIAVLFAARTDGQTLSAVYTDLGLGTVSNLTARGTLDWVKWGNNETSGSLGWMTVRKDGFNQIISSTLTKLGNAGSNPIVLAAYSNKSVLKFNWSDGQVPVNGTSDTVVMESLFFAQDSYPIGLGVTATATATTALRHLQVWVQGFNSDMLVTASLSGGLTSQVTISPAKHPALDPTNFYSSGLYDVLYSGSDQTLSISVRTVSPTSPGQLENFPTAGIFAMAVSAPLRGDFDRDGQITKADIPEMLEALTDLSAYKSKYSMNDLHLAAIGDFNGTGTVTNRDIQGLLNLVSSGAGSTSPVPEPSAFALLAIGGILLHRARGGSSSARVRSPPDLGTIRGHETATIQIARPNHRVPLLARPAVRMRRRLHEPSTRPRVRSLPAFGLQPVVACDVESAPKSSPAP